MIEQIKLIYFSNNESEKNALLILHQVLKNIIKLLC